MKFYKSFKFLIKGKKKDFMEPEYLDNHIVLSTDKYHIFVLSWIEKAWKILISFDSKHTQKISSIIPLFDNSKNLKNLISFSHDKQIKIFSPSSTNTNNELVLTHQRFIIIIA